jgi:quercetin dioxygenase-like cupin family protein
MHPKPYNENGSVRIFSKNANSKDLIWHTDLEDREIAVISGDWLFQFDNELPFELKAGSKVFIPKDTWHRIIKGSEDLVLNIKKL